MKQTFHGFNQNEENIQPNSPDFDFFKQGPLASFCFFFCLKSLFRTSQSARVKSSVIIWEREWGGGGVGKRISRSDACVSWSWTPPTKMIDRKEKIQNSRQVARYKRYLCQAVHYQLSGSTSRGMGSPSLSLKSWLALGSCKTNKQSWTNEQKLL